MNSMFEAIAQQLAERGLSVSDSVLKSTRLDQLRKEAISLWKEGELKVAAVGKGLAKQRINKIRGDEVKWLDKQVATEAQLEYWTLVDGLRLHLSEFFRIHLERTELHFAVYPKGAFYSKHFDQFQTTSNRIFSIVLYLNPEWKQGDGGELRVYHSDQHSEDFEPINGRLIVFRSDAVEHEVLMANAPRVSLTGWMRRDPLLL